MPPSLTIVIPTKDRPNFIQASVASALAALPEDGALIVVDDKGEKPASESLKSFDDNRLRVLRNTGTTGPSGARNFGVAAATSDVVLFLDDDDLMKPGYPAYVTERAEIARYGFCAIDTFETAPAQIPRFLHSTGQDVAPLPFRRQLAGIGCGFWIWRQEFNALGGIDTTLRVNEDTDLSIRLRAAALTGWYEDGAGVLIRLHHAVTGAADLGQITQRSKAGDRAGYFAAIIAKNHQYLAQNPAAMRHLQKRLVKMQAKAGLWADGWQTCRHAPGLIPYFMANLLIYSRQRG